jgi:hypothetical protein
MKRALEDEIEDIREELGDDCTVERLLMELAAARFALAEKQQRWADMKRERNRWMLKAMEAGRREPRSIIADDPHDDTRRTMDPAAIAAMDRFTEKHGDRLNAPGPVTFVRARYAEPPTGETGPEYAASVAAGFVEDEEE